MDASKLSDNIPAMPNDPLGLRPDLADKADLFRALGDRTRLRMLHLLRDRERCVRDLVDDLEMAQATVSHHLRTLEKARLVVSNRRGRVNYNRVTILTQKPLSIF